MQKKDPRPLWRCGVVGGCRPWTRLRRMRHAQMANGRRPPAGNGGGTGAPVAVCDVDCDTRSARGAARVGTVLHALLEEAGRLDWHLHAGNRYNRPHFFLRGGHNKSPQHPMLLTYDESMHSTRTLRLRRRLSRRSSIGALEATRRSPLGERLEDGGVPSTQCVPRATAPEQQCHAVKYSRWVSARATRMCNGQQGIHRAQDCRSHPHVDATHGNF